MTRVDVAKLLELPEDERAEIAQQLLDSLPSGTIPAWHLEVLRERLAEADARPGTGIPWEDVEAELWPQQ